MRLVFMSLHENNFLCKPFNQIISRNNVHTWKHRYIIDYALKHGIEVINIISKNVSVSRKGRIIRKIIPNYDFLRAKFVINKNKFSNKIRYENSISAINDSDVFISYFHHKYEHKIINNLNCKTVMMGNHFIDIDEIFSFENINVSYFVNEINLTNNAFINKYFKMGMTKHFVCPYTFEPRFINKNIFGERKNKLLAIGTLSNVHFIPGNKKFREFFVTEWIQPMRKEILDNKDLITDYIDSKISWIMEDKLKVDNNSKSIINKLKIIYNKFVPWRQKKYTSFNMVDKFNEYKMFCCPEEIVGMPGIGFVEGMACGCAYFGLDHDMYKSLGLIPGVHYITYDGTLSGLIDRVKYYQQNWDELKKIADAGTRFVRENFNQEKVAGDLINKLRELVGENI